MSAIDVTQHIGLVHHVIRRHSFAAPSVRGSLELEDLVQHGLIGVMRATEDFDASRGASWSTYAAHWIRAHIGRAIANEGCAVRVPVHRQERRRQRGERVRPIVASLDASTIADDAEGPSLLEKLASEDMPPDARLEAEAERAEAAALIARAKLSPRESRVAELRASGLTLLEIARELGISRERVRQVLLEAKAKVELARDGATPTPVRLHARRTQAEARAAARAARRAAEAATYAVAAE